MNYAATALSVANKIKSAGKPITLIRPAGGTFSGASGTQTGGSTVTTPGFGLEVAGETKLIAAGVVQNSSKTLLVAGLPEPTPGQDKITVDGVTMSVSVVKPVKPAGVMIYYEVVLE